MPDLDWSRAASDKCQVRAVWLTSVCAAPWVCLRDQMCVYTRRHDRKHDALRSHDDYHCPAGRASTFMDTRDFDRSLYGGGRVRCRP